MIDRRLRTCGLVCALALGACTQTDAPSSGPAVSSRATDAGRTIPRVVAASAGALDWLTWTGVLESVVAVPQQAERYSNGWSQALVARRLPRFANFRAEVLLGFTPDLVVCDGYQNPLTVRALEQARVRVCSLRPLRTLEDLDTNLAALIDTLSPSLLSDDASARLLARLQRERDELLERGDIAGATVLPYYELGGSVSSAGRGTSESVLLELVGAVNHAETLGLEGHGRLPFEQMLANPPVWILASDGPQLAALRARARMRTLEACQRGRILLLPSRLRQANSPFVFEAARRLRAQLERHEAKTK